MAVVGCGKNSTLPPRHKPAKLLCLIGVAGQCYFPMWNELGWKSKGINAERDPIGSKSLFDPTLFSKPSIDGVEVLSEIAS
jgi:hypothetical protein